MVNDIERIPIASLADLIGSTETEKWIVIDGKKIKIRKLDLGTLQRIYAYAKDDPFQTTIALLQASIVEPKITVTDASKMNPLLANKIVREITDFSGFTEEQVRESKNL